LTGEHLRKVKKMPDARTQCRPVNRTVLRLFRLRVFPEHSQSISFLSGREMQKSQQNWNVFLKGRVCFSAVYLEVNYKRQ